MPHSVRSDRSSVSNSIRKTRERNRSIGRTTRDVRTSRPPTPLGQPAEGFTLGSTFGPKGGPSDTRPTATPTRQTHIPPSSPVTPVRGRELSKPKRSRDPVVPPLKPVQAKQKLGSFATASKGGAGPATSGFPHDHDPHDLSGWQKEAGMRTPTSTRLEVHYKSHVALRDYRAKLLDIRGRLQQFTYSKFPTVRQLMVDFDDDKDGVLSMKDWLSGIKRNNFPVTEKEAKHLFRAIDFNGDNALQYDELVQILQTESLTSFGNTEDPDDVVARTTFQLFTRKMAEDTIKEISRESMFKPVPRPAKRNYHEVSVDRDQGVRPKNYDEEKEFLRSKVLELCGESRVSGRLVAAFKQFDPTGKGYLTPAAFKRLLTTEMGLNFPLQRRELDILAFECADSQGAIEPYKMSKFLSMPHANATEKRDEDTLKHISILKNRIKEDLEAAETFTKTLPPYPEADTPPATVIADKFKVTANITTASSRPSPGFDFSRPSTPGSGTVVSRDSPASRPRSAPSGVRHTSKISDTSSRPPTAASRPRTPASRPHTAASRLHTPSSRPGTPASRPHTAASTSSRRSLRHAASSPAFHDRPGTSASDRPRTSESRMSRNSSASDVSVMSLSMGSTMRRSATTLHPALTVQLNGGADYTSVRTDRGSRRPHGGRASGLYYSKNGKESAGELMYPRSGRESKGFASDRERLVRKSLVDAPPLPDLRPDNFMRPPRQPPRRSETESERLRRLGMARAKRGKVMEERVMNAYRREQMINDERDRRRIAQRTRQYLSYTHGVMKESGELDLVMQGAQAR